MTRLSLIMIALVLTCSFATFSSADDWLDDFSADAIGKRWTKDMGRGAKISLNAERQVLVLKSGNNAFNHIETSLPADVSVIQADINTVNDASASWSPSIILYWAPDQWLQVQLSQIEGLTISGKAGKNKIKTQLTKYKIVPDTWYRGRLELTQNSIEVFFGKQSTKLSAMAKIKRQEGWRGAPTLILGKGYAGYEGGAPDFDNDYRWKDTKVVTVLIDNVAVGHPANLEERLKKSVQIAKPAGNLQASKLDISFWPNSLHKKTGKTIWRSEERRVGKECRSRWSPYH